MNDFAQTFRDMPISSLIAVGLLVFIGLLLWAAGRRILRVGFAVLGLVLGSTAGWILGQVMNLGVGSLITAMVGGIVLAIVMAIAYRLAIAGAMAAIFSIVAPTGVIAFAEWQARSEGKSLSEVEAKNPITDEITGWIQKHDQPETREHAAEALQGVAESTKEQLDRAKAALSETFKGKADAEIAALQQFGSRMIEVIRAKWDGTPQTLRPTLTISMIAGCVFGLFLGLVVPTLSAAIVTALGGSLLWLCGVQILAVRFGIAEKIWLPSSGGGWLTVWLITSLVGVVIQWTFRKRAADKPA